MSREAIDVGSLWRDLSRRIESLSELVLGEGAPTGGAQRAAGLRYLTRFLAAGLRLCIEHDDADHPVFARMIENAMSWGLDNPDCNYSWARVRGDASYRIAGWRGTAKQIEFQVNTGHFADGRIPALSGGEGGWRTVSFLAGDALACDAEGRFEIALSRDRRPGNWLRLDDEASFVLVRQYFDDWETERPGVFTIEREGASYPPPPLSPEQLRARFERLFEWLDTGARCWDKVSRLLLSLAPNTLLMFDVSEDVDRPGLHGQSYGMGPFVCAPEEAVIVEFPVPRCRMWSVALTSFWWETLEFGSRQTSLNGHWARVDDDGVFRGVIAHRDPGVPNWLDTEGCERGTLAVRFLFADAVPKTSLRVVPFDALRTALPSDTPAVGPAERSAVLARRSRALQRRYAY
jgi:ribosomal protein S16